MLHENAASTNPFDVISLFHEAMLTEKKSEMFDVTTEQLQQSIELLNVDRKLSKKQLDALQTNGYRKAMVCFFAFENTCISLILFCFHLL